MNLENLSSDKLNALDAATRAVIDEEGWSYEDNSVFDSQNLRVQRYVTLVFTAVEAYLDALEDPDSEEDDYPECTACITCGKSRSDQKGCPDCTPGVRWEDVE